MNLEQFFSHDAVVPMKKLADITLETNSTQLVELNPAEQGWAEYAFVLVRYLPGPDSEAFGSFVYFNDSHSNGNYVRLAVTADKYESTGDFFYFQNYYPLMYLFFTAGSGDHPLAGLMEYNGKLSACYNYPTLIKNLTSMKFRAEYTFAAGSKFEVWGIL